jgi:hypothetical protein
VGSGHRTHRFSGWYLDVPQREVYETEILLEELLDMIEPHADGLAQVRRVLSWRLVKLDLWLDCDQYLY